MLTRVCVYVYLCSYKCARVRVTLQEKFQKMYFNALYCNTFQCTRMYYCCLFIYFLFYLFWFRFVFFSLKIFILFGTVIGTIPMVRKSDCKQHTHKITKLSTTMILQIRSILYILNQLNPPN